MDPNDATQQGAAPVATEAPAQEPQMRSFDQDTISKLNAIGVDHTNADQLKEAGFEPYAEGVTPPAAAAPVDTPATADPGTQPAATPQTPAFETPLDKAGSTHNV